MGNIKKLLFYGFFTIISSASFSGDLVAEQVLLKSMVKEYILPAHDQFYSDVETLDHQITRFCVAPNDKALNQTEFLWKRAMASWAMIGPVNFGPIDEENLLWRFQFWPDAINLVHRKFKSRIKGSNINNSAEELAAASVAIQGLSALEYLIYEAGAGVQKYQSSPHMCLILQGTSKNLVENAKLLNHLWKNETTNRWLAIEKLKPDHLTYNVESLFSGLVMALDFSKTKKLGKPLGLKNKDRTKRQANPWQLESWRSGASLNNILAGLKAGQKMYTMEFGLSWYLAQKSPQTKQLDDQIRQQFSNTIGMANTIGDTLFTLVNEGKVETMVALYQHISDLHDLLKINYAQAAGIQFRFNAHDGD